MLAWLAALAATDLADAPGVQTSSGYKEGYDAGMQLAKQRQAAMMAPAPRPVLPAMATAQLQARPMAMAAPQMASNMVIR